MPNYFAKQQENPSGLEYAFKQLRAEHVAQRSRTTYILAPVLIIHNLIY